MQSIDQEGKTVEEALEKALATLEREKEDVDYEVLDEGSKGVLGVGARPILIRVRVKDVQEVSTLKNLVHSFLTDLDLNFSDLDAQVGKNDIIKVTMNTEDAAILIGKHGQTLDAIQYIFNQVMHDTKYKLMVDISSYKEKHNNKLIETVRKIASSVRQSKRRITLKPMTAFERRIVHEAVKEFPDLTTKSIGVEPDRRVVISLLNAPEYDEDQRPQRYNSRPNNNRYGNNRNSGGGYQNRNSGGGYQNRNSGGGYQQRDNGNYQPREGGYQNRNSGGGYQQRDNGNYQPRESGYQNRNSGGGYQQRDNGNYQPRESGYQNRNSGGGYQQRDNGNYQPREGGYQNRNSGGGYQQRDNGNYQPREGGYQNRNSGGGGYQQRDNGNYQPREGGYRPRRSFDGPELGNESND